MYSIRSDSLVQFALGEQTIKLHMHSVLLKDTAVTQGVTYSNGVAMGTKTGNFISEHSQSEGLAYHGFNNITRLTEANIGYCFEARISAPSSCYGKGCLSDIEHFGETFVINNRIGAGTAGRSTSQKWQVSGLQITLHKI